jgi:prefoldin subunit 5
MGLPFPSTPSFDTFMFPNMFLKVTVVNFVVPGVIFDFASFSFHVPICGSAAKHAAHPKKQNARINPIAFVFMTAIESGFLFLVNTFSGAMIPTGLWRGASVRYLIMTDERIEKIKSAVESADHISPEKKAELLDVIAKLKPAIAEVAQTHEEEADRISRFVEASAREVASKKERPESLERVLHKLKQTVEKFEASHPELTAFVTEYSAVLSGLGI